MTKGEKLKSELFALCPDFANGDEEAWELWDDNDGTHNVHQVFTVLSHYVSDRLEAGKTSGLDPIFRFVETQLGGGEELDNAACTCFLENIMNRVPSCFPLAAFVELLGPESREFCQGWDKWCGIGKWRDPI